MELLTLGQALCSALCFCCLISLHMNPSWRRRLGPETASDLSVVTLPGNLRGAIIGHGVVDVPECLRIIKSHGYDGWLSVEFEGMEDCIQGLTYNLANLKEMLNK